MTRRNGLVSSLTVCVGVVVLATSGTAARQVRSNARCLRLSDEERAEHRRMAR